MIGFIIALVSGALMSIQGVFNTEVSKQTGLWTASSFVQFTGLLTCLAVGIFAERDQSFKSHESVAEICAPGRSHGCGHYLYGDQEHRFTRAGKICHADCGCTADCLIPDRGFRTVWGRKNRVSVDEACGRRIVCCRHLNF